MPKKLGGMFQFLDEKAPGIPLVETEDTLLAAGTVPEKKPRPLAKSKSPDYTKIGVYLRISTARALKSRLAGEELSDLFEQLATEWLDKNKG